MKRPGFLPLFICVYVYARVSVCVCGDSDRIDMRDALKTVSAVLNQVGCSILQRNNKNSIFKK